MTNENSAPGTGAARRQRMGGQPAESPVARSAPPPAAPSVAPVHRKRMGLALAPAPAPASAAAAIPETGPAKENTAAPAPSRMGLPAARPPAVVPSINSPHTVSGPDASTGTSSPIRFGSPRNPPADPPTAQKPAAPTIAQKSAPSGGAKPGGRPAWVKPVVITALVLVLALAAVLGARWLRTLEPVQAFIAMYDGHSTQPDGAPAGVPAWLGWQHFFNMFFMVLIIRTGLQVRNERKPPGYWTAKKDSFFSPKGNTPKKVSLTQWLHQSLDVLWVLNGLIFVILLFVTGQWMRIVPTGWDVVPNLLSTGVQYASLDWPTENGWVHYNALQVMTYFITVFIAAPLAIISGIRISTWWPEKATALGKAYPVEWARAIHVPVMIYFVAFTVVHVFLVFFTGALRNLNHMFTSRDVVDWWGLIIFLASLAVTAATWFLTNPLFTTPIAGWMGKVSR